MIDEYQSYTPRSLMHALAECKTNDTASLMTSVIVLCKMIESLNGTIASISAKNAELSRNFEALQHASCSKEAVKPISAKQPKSKGMTVSWEIGEKVFLNWPDLPNHRRTELVSVRMHAGSVKAFRRGQGIRTTVGVAFGLGPDGELTWMQPEHLSRTLAYVEA